MDIDIAIKNKVPDVEREVTFFDIDDAADRENFKFSYMTRPLHYESTTAERIGKGFLYSLEEMQDIPEEIEIFGKQLNYGFGKYFGDDEEEVNRKLQNLTTAQRNLDEIKAKRYEFLSKDDADSLSFAFGSGLANYGVMLFSGLGLGSAAKIAGMGAKAVGTAGSLAVGAIMEGAEQSQGKMPRTKEGELDIAKMTPEWARKTGATTLAYMGVSTLLEKYAGFGRQVKIWEKPIKFNKTILPDTLKAVGRGSLGALSEGTTEGLQALAAMGINLADGTITMADLPEQTQQAFKEFLVGTMVGGTVGTTVAINQRINIKQDLRNMINPVIADENKTEEIVNELFDKGVENFQQIISTELELSSELKNKHGKIWNSMLSAVDKAMQDSGAFTGMTEDERASYANTAAKHFADQVLAEANLRGTTLDAILKDTDITYDNGIKIARNINLFDALKNPEMIPPQTKLKRVSLNQFIRSKGGVKDVGGDLKSRGAVKEYPGLINKNGMSLDDMAMMAWENGYFPEFSERPTVNDLLDAIDEGLRGNNRYNTEEARDFNDAIADLEEELDRLGIDWKNMTAAEIEQAVNEIPELKRLEREAAFYENFEPDIEREITGMTEEERDAYDERRGMQLYQESDENIYGATNSDEEPIANPANFNIFIAGSRVTDNDEPVSPENPPKKIYRGDTRYFEEYEPQDNAYEYDWGKGFYLSDNYDDVAANYQSGGADLTNRIEREAEQLSEDEDIDYDEAKKKIREKYEQGDIIREFYLSIKEPVIIGGEKETFFDYTEEYNEETDEYGEPQGKLLDMIYEIENYLADIGADEYTQAITGRLYEEAINEGGLSASQIEDIVRGTEEANYLIDYESTAGEMLSSVWSALGFDGIIDHRAGTKFKNMNMDEHTTHYVVFNSEQAKSVDNKGQWGVTNKNFYYQGKTPKGVTTITPDAYIIKLLENADESTLPHELAHYWLSEMWNYTRTGRASESYMKRWQIISDYLGIKPEQTRLSRGQQEKFASSYEAYLTRGELPTPLIGSAFDDYDKWLQKVYSDYNKINYQSGMGKRKVRLTDAAVKFFQSMTTGSLEAPALAPKDTGVKLETEPQLPATTSNELIEEPAVSDTTIVTRGDKGVSKVYKRGALLHPEAVSQPGLSYDKIHLDEQALAAKEFVEKDLNKAREFIGGEKNETGKLTRTAVMLAYENEMLRIGNLDEYDRVRKINAYESVRHGQEIAAQRIETDDVTNPTYWLEKAEHNLANQVAQKLFKGKERTKQLTETIKKETESLQKAITGKTVAEQQQIMRQTAERLKKEYGLDTLYQMPDDINDMTTQEFIKEVFGINLDGETRNDIINKSEQVRKLWENTIAKGGNPSVEAMKAKRELNDLINSKTPSNALAIWTSIFGRGVMLTSVKSPVLNIISNIEAGVTEGITRRLMYNTTEKAVDKSVKKEFRKYAWEVYKASADIVTTMNDYDDDMRIIGEQILHSQGQGRFRAASRKVEEVSFKYLMGAPDAIAKTFAFNDTADLLATKIAREEGAKDISKRATEIYKDAILIKPETEQGQLVRKQAQEQAHYTTFTNDSWAAKFGLKAREFLNTVGQGKIRLGDLAMKFVKTPANVQMMGLEYGFGLLYTAYNVQEIIKNPQSETSKIAIKAAVRNGLGVALAALLYSMLDPDDYFSEFDTLNPKEKDRMRARGAMPNSIKIGNRWVSLDYFGQLGIPLVGMLEAKRNNGLRSYVQSGLTQAAKIPGIKETKQLIDSMSEYARYDLPPEKIAQMMAGTVLDQARAMTIPAIVNDIAKMTDDYERDTMGGVMDKVIASIPGLRKTLPERYGIQGVVKTEAGQSPIVGRALTLLAGSRVKTAQEDRLVREVEKLAGKDEQPSISDVTKYGDLRLLSPEKKVKVRKEFYKLYNSESKKLIATREYQKKTPEDKKKALNKVRSRVVKSLKEKYSNDIQREKRRR